MILKLLIPFLFVQLLLAEPQDLQCKLPRSKICQLDVVTTKGNQLPELPDLTNKHTLIVRSGSIVDLSKELADQFGGVTKLQLGPLGIRSLYISPKWVSLKAESNQIYELVVEELEAMDASETDESPDPEDDAESSSTGVPVILKDVNEIRVLNLANNKLKSVTQLKHLFKLEELLLDGNQIEFIELDTFAGMMSLKKLVLTKNKINRISADGPVNLPALEKLFLAFNELTKLEIKHWNMLQLSHLDLSHNRLVQIDVPTLNQFVSLEKLAISNNSWHCEYLMSAVKNIGRSFVLLEDSGETCPKELFVVEGYCCSYAQSVEDEPISAQDRIRRIEDEKSLLKKELSEKVDAYRAEWTKGLDSLQREAEEKLKPYKEMEKRAQKDDNKQVQRAMEEFERLITECERLLGEIKRVAAKNKEYTQKFTNLFYTTLAEKNKLLQEMSNAGKLEEEMKRYEMSFKANNKSV